MMMRRRRRRKGSAAADNYHDRYQDSRLHVLLDDDDKETASILLELYIPRVLEELSPKSPNHALQWAFRRRRSSSSAYDDNAAVVDPTPPTPPPPTSLMSVISENNPTVHSSSKRPAATHVSSQSKSDDEGPINVVVESCCPPPNPTTNTLKYSSIVDHDLKPHTTPPPPPIIPCLCRSAQKINGRRVVIFEPSTSSHPPLPHALLHDVCNSDHSHELNHSNNKRPAKKKTTEELKEELKTLSARKKLLEEEVLKEVERYEKVKEFNLLLKTIRKQAEEEGNESRLGGLVRVSDPGEQQQQQIIPVTAHDQGPSNVNNQVGEVHYGDGVVSENLQNSSNGEGTSHSSTPDGSTDKIEPINFLSQVSL